MEAKGASDVKLLSLLLFHRISIAAVSWACNRLDIFGLGTNNEMVHKWWDGSKWGPSVTDWEPLGGTFSSPPTVVSWGADRLDIFGLGTDDQMYRKWWNGSWGPFTLWLGGARRDLQQPTNYCLLGR